MKKCTPYSFGQLFKFEKKKKNSANLALVRSLGLRDDTKSMIAASSESGVSFYKSYKKNEHYIGTIDCKILGYPRVDQNKINKLFNGTKPDGYFDRSLSHSFIEALLRSNFVSLEVIKNIRPINKPTNVVIDSGVYTSTKFFQGNYEKINLANNYTDRQAGRLATGAIAIENYTWNFFDFYVPSYNFSEDSAPDLAILPTGSIVWVWETPENKWTTCTVENTKSKNGTKIKSEFKKIELDSEKVKYTDVILSTREMTEKSLTNTIQKMIQKDEIRIVISSLKHISPSSSSYNKVHINQVILKLMKNSFKCDFLEALKLSLFDSSEYKSCNSFKEFMYLLFRKKGQPLVARYQDKHVLNNVVTHAIKAAENCEPLFWGIKETALWITEEEEQKKIQKTLSHNFCHNTDDGISIDLAEALKYSNSQLTNLIGYYDQSIIQKQSVEVNTIIDIQKRVLLQREDTETYNVCISTPKYIHEMGEKAVRKFVKAKLDSIKEHNKISYMAAGRSSDSTIKLSRVQEIEGCASLSTQSNYNTYGDITIKEINS
jgi:hypothetical protein